jgi:hypothetical protein
MVRCVTLVEQFPHPSTGAGSEHLARLTGELGFEVLQECWTEVTGAPVPEVVLSYPFRAIVKTCG